MARIRLNDTSINSRIKRLNGTENGDVLSFDPGSGPRAVLTFDGKQGRDTLLIRLTNAELNSVGNLLELSKALTDISRVGRFNLDFGPDSIRGSSVESLRIVVQGDEFDVGSIGILDSSITSVRFTESTSRVAGRLDFFDLDRGQHTVEVLDPIGLYGRLSAGLRNSAETDGVGEVRWIYTPNSNIRSLNNSDRVVENFTIRITDKDGNIAEETVTLNIQGSGEGGRGIRPPQTKTIGVVVDGYITGATVFIDRDGDGVLDTGEESAVSTASGRYTLTSVQPGGIVTAVGGKNADTGLDNNFIFRLPTSLSNNVESVRVLSPVTSLIHATADRNQTSDLISQKDLTKASAQVAKALGLSTFNNGLISLDPLATFTAASSSAARKEAALSVFKEGVKLALLTEAVLAFSNEDNPQVISRLLDSLAGRVVQLPQGGRLDLTSSTLVESFLREVPLNSRLPEELIPELALLLVDIATRVGQAVSPQAISQLQIEFNNRLNELLNNPNLALNDPPSTLPVDLGTLPEDSPDGRTITQADLLANARDPERDMLTAINLEVSSGNGTLISLPNGSWIFTPTKDDDTQVSFRYTITDNGSSNGVSDPKSVVGSAQLDLTAVNDAPNALNDEAETTAATLVDINVLANDTDVDNPSGELSIKPGSLTVEAGQGLAVIENGRIRFTPSDDFTGVAEIAYTVTDGSLEDSAVAKVNVLADPNKLRIVEQPQVFDADNAIPVDPFGVRFKFARPESLDEGLIRINNTILASGPDGNVASVNTSLTTGTFTVRPLELALSGTLNIAVGPQISRTDVEVLIGTEGIDQSGLVASTKRSIQYGFSGNDNLTGGALNDTFFGGEGSDNLSGEAGDDTFFYTSAGQFITPPETETLQIVDVINGGDGLDTLIISNNAPIVIRQETSFAGIQQVERLKFFTPGEEVQLFLNQSALTAGIREVDFSGLSTSAGLKGATLDISPAFIVLDFKVTGSGGIDNISTVAGSDLIDAGGGDDKLAGRAGNDTLRGGEGNDSIEGQADDDLLEGGGGNDTLRGGEQEDSIYGGDGADSISGDQENDFIDGGNGNDTIDAVLGRDTVMGGGGNDRIMGGFGGNLLAYGDEGNDRIQGSAISDTLFGGAGDDTIYGFIDGSDQITTGEGFDYVVVVQTVLFPGTAPVIDFVTVTDFDVVADTIGVARGSLVNETGTYQEIDVQLVNNGEVYRFAGSESFISNAAFLELANGNREAANLSVGTDGTELLKYLSTNGTASGIGLPTGFSFEGYYFIAYDNNHAYVYHGDASDPVITAQDIQLVGVLNDVNQNALSGSNFRIEVELFVNFFS